MPKLTDSQRSKLKEAAERDGRRKKELASLAGLRDYEFSRILSGVKKEVPDEGLRALVATLGLDHDEFFVQLEIPLDNERMQAVEGLVLKELGRLSRKVKTLRGDSFHVFVGFRVDGAVRQVFEGMVALHPLKGGKAAPADAA